MVEKCIEEIGIGFMFAPLFHPAMKYVMNARKETGVRTVFNILGPMTNPAGAKSQVIGVFNPALMKDIANVMKNLGSRHVMVVNGDGLDEITIAGKTKVEKADRSERTSFPPLFCLGFQTERFDRREPAPYFRNSIGQCRASFRVLHLPRSSSPNGFPWPRLGER
jgi:anthranilate phosphoribosyltransferase